MSFLRSVGLFVCRLYGDDVPNYSPVERWALKNSKLCSADEIIAAAVIKSFADSYEDWSLKMWELPYDHIPSDELLPPGCSRYDTNTRLVNSKKKFKIYWKWSNDSKSVLNMHVNNVSITESAAREIQKAFSEVKGKRDAIEAAARRAKAEMERNEAAWNLVEKLLGMKRNEFGALVPVTVEKEEA